MRIGTGNHHAGTARLYSDLGRFPCDPEIGEDPTELRDFAMPLLTMAAS